MSTLKLAARIGANTLPAIRVYAGYRTAEHLRTDMLHLENRSWPFAGRVALGAGTDVIDGVLARYAGTTRVGGYLDQLADKAWFLLITRQLVANHELPQRHLHIPAARDVGTLVLRPLAQHYGYKTDAQLAGKIKMWAQVGACVAACSPIAYEQPEFVESLFDVATGAAVVSGVDMLHGYVRDFTTRYPDQPVAQLLVTATEQIAPYLPQAV